MPAHSPKWANTPPRGPKEAPKLLFKHAENARTIRSKRSRPSGWHAKRPNMQFHQCFTSQTCPWAEKAPVLINFWRVPRGPREGPKRPPRGLLAAMPPRGPKEAPKTPPRSRICEWSLRFPRVWRCQFLAYLTVVSAPPAPRRVPPCLKVVNMQGPFTKNAVLASC